MALALGTTVATNKGKEMTYYIVKLPVVVKSKFLWPGDNNETIEWEDLGMEFESKESAERTCVYEDFDDYRIYRVNLVQETRICD